MDVMDRVEAPREDPRLTRAERMAILATWIVLGIIESVRTEITGRLTQRPFEWTAILAGNMPWWLAWAGLTPLVIAIARRVSPRDGWWRFLTIHVLVGTVLSIGHIVIVGTLYYYTHTRGGVLPMTGEVATPFVQVRTFIALYAFLNVTTYAAIVAAFHGLTFHKRYRAEELRAARLEAGMHEARLAALRMELSPHFLFNTLHAIAGLVRLRQTDSAVRMLARLSELLRTTLERGNETVVPLEQELGILAPYLEILRIRFGERLQVDVSVDDSVRSALVPPLILQPVVENAVKHGVSKHRGPAAIGIHAATRDGELLLRVSNTGGRELAPEELTGAREGIGLANTRHRLKELYGARGGFVLRPRDGGGAEADIRFPLSYSPDSAASP